MRLRFSFLCRRSSVDQKEEYLVTMSQRYVRVQTQDGKIYYGLLQLNRDVLVFHGPPWRTETATDLVLRPDTYQLLAPCIPSKIICVGKNYADHAEETQSEVPTQPLLFLKPPTAVIGTGQDIPYPSQSQQVDYEGELALLIGQRCKDCSPETAQSFIWGYTIANDVTARDLQRRDPQWTRAKGFDGFCPLGPWIVRTLALSACLKTYVNGVERQCSTLDQMVFSPAQIVAFVSQVMTLLPGDIILTGTPAGVGPIKIGDRVKVEIESIGTLENCVADIPPST